MRADRKTNRFVRPPVERWPLPFLSDLRPQPLLRAALRFHGFQFRFPEKKGGKLFNLQSPVPYGDYIRARTPSFDRFRGCTRRIAVAAVAGRMHSRIRISILIVLPSNRPSESSLIYTRGSRAHRGVVHAKYVRAHVVARQRFHGDEIDTNSDARIGESTHHRRRASTHDFFFNAR